MEAGPDAALTLPSRAMAGIRLAERLTSLRGARPVVLAIPRGGAPVALAMSKALGGVFDVLVSLELAPAEDPHKPFGAVAEFGGLAFDSHRGPASENSLSDESADVQRVARDVVRRAQFYRGEQSFPALDGRTVIVATDGVVHAPVATAALRAVRSQGPKKLVFAAGVMSRSTRIELRQEAEESVALREPEYLTYVAEWYRDFPTVSDEEIRAMLRSSPRGIPH